MHDGTDHLAPWTTLRLGGPAGHLALATRSDEVPELVRGRPDLLVLAGGSNVVIADEGFPGTVLLLRSTGLAVTRGDEEIIVTASAGEPWDGLVDCAVSSGWAGLECLSGIPGSAGATPIQNVGAYGQEVAETIIAVRVYDRERDEIVTFPPEACGFGYRKSIFRHRPRWIVLDVAFRLVPGGLSAPIRDPELARALGVSTGARVPVVRVREAVLALRAAKGMVLDPTDRDTYSVGSFFTNPVLSPAAFAAIRERAAAAYPPAEPPAWAAPGGAVKTSAAWLIEHAGFGKGYGRNGVSISTKHTLALTNRGTGTTAALLDLAREIRDGVADRFGVVLVPEPVLVNCAL